MQKKDLLAQGVFMQLAQSFCSSSDLQIFKRNLRHVLALAAKNME
ncbi:MAG TPA: hypothetical protein VFU50_14885 [Terriglobales bacterium]|nr:hypothetical protein [Terriglobales bacterium]